MSIADEIRKLGLDPDQCTIGPSVGEAMRGAFEAAPVDDRVPEVRLYLPWPPALNNLYANVGRRRVLTRAGRDYKKAVAAIVAEKRPGRVVGKLVVSIWAYPPDRRKRDLDGLFKAALDALGEAWVYEDDSQIVRLEIDLGKVVKGGMLGVCVRGDLPK